MDGIKLRAGDEGGWQRDGGAIVAMDPSDGAIRALASYPTYKPSVYAGRKTSQELAPLSDTEGGREGRTIPALNRAIAGLYPPGSTFKPVTALPRCRSTSSARTTRCSARRYSPPRPVPGGTSSRTGTRSSNQSMTLPTAIAQSCDTYFYQVGKEFYDLPPDRGQPLQDWARRFGFGERTGLDVGPRSAPASCRRSRGATTTYTKKTDPTTGRSTGSGSRATRSSSRSARRTCWSRRCRWPASTRCSRTAGSSSRRTSSGDVEQPGGSGQAAAAVLRSFRPGAQAAQPRPGGDPGHSRRASTGRRTRRSAPRPRVFGQLPDRDRRQDRDGGEARRRSGLPSARSTRPGGAAMGPYRRARSSSSAR